MSRREMRRRRCAAGDSKDRGGDGGGEEQKSGASSAGGVGGGKGNEDGEGVASGHGSRGGAAHSSSGAVPGTTLGTIDDAADEDEASSSDGWNDRHEDVKDEEERWEKALEPKLLKWMKEVAPKVYAKIPPQHRANTLEVNAAASDVRRLEGKRAQGLDPSEREQLEQARKLGAVEMFRRLAILGKGYLDERAVLDDEPGSEFKSAAEVEKSGETGDGVAKSGEVGTKGGGEGITKDVDEGGAAGIAQVVPSQVTAVDDVMPDGVSDRCQFAHISNLLVSTADECLSEVTQLRLARDLVDTQLVKVRDLVDSIGCLGVLVRELSADLRGWCALDKGHHTKLDVLLQDIETSTAYLDTLVRSLKCFYVDMVISLARSVIDGPVQQMQDGLREVGKMASCIRCCDVLAYPPYNDTEQVWLEKKETLAAKALGEGLSTIDVRLDRAPGQGLGMEIEQIFHGSDNDPDPLHVRVLQFYRGDDNLILAAEKCGQIEVGDRIVGINGWGLHYGQDGWQSIQSLQTHLIHEMGKSPTDLMLILQRRTTTDVCPAAAAPWARPSVRAEEAEEITAEHFHIERTANAIEHSADHWLEMLSQDDIHGLFRVAPRWARMVRAVPHRWRHISITERALIDNAGLARCLALSQNNLQSLHIEDLPSLDGLNLELLSHQPNLQSLKIIRCYGVDAGAILASGFTRVQFGGNLADDFKLDCLELHGCKLEAADLEVFVLQTKSVDVYACENCEAVELYQAQCTGVAWEGHPECVENAGPTCEECAETTNCGRCNTHFCSVCIAGPDGNGEMNHCDACDENYCNSNAATESPGCTAANCEEVMSCDVCDSSFCECKSVLVCLWCQFATCEDCEYLPACNACCEYCCLDCGRVECTVCCEAWCADCAEDMLTCDACAESWCRKCCENGEMTTTCSDCGTSLCEGALF